MERLPDRHLSFDELTRLASGGRHDGAYQRFGDEESKCLERHVLECIECRELLRQQQFLEHITMPVANIDTSKLDLDCPSEQEWMEIVAGFAPPGESEAQLDHARHCVLCCVRLKRISEQFAAEKTVEERQILDRLASATPDWEANLARRMYETTSPEGQPAFEVNKRPSRRLWQFAYALASATILIGSALWTAYSSSARSADRLLAAAYSEQRTLDLRIANALYSPVKTLRGESTEIRPPAALFEAQAIIAKGLASHPDDPFWLDAQGRADLINGNYSLALASLERAQQFRSDDNAIHIDLASAYFLRGAILKRSEDYGRAADLLGQVLSKDPGNSLARFNRAIISERLFLYEQAREDWDYYLSIDPNSPWSEEARRHRTDILDKIKLQKEKSERPLLNPSEFLASLKDNQDIAARETDLRIEQYFDLALSEWLPEAFSSTTEAKTRSARDALSHLSEILISNHGDYWLRDFLDGLDNIPGDSPALLSLNDFFRFEGNGDLDRARISSVNAGVAFHRMGNKPGEFIAKFESSYVDQLAHQVSDCLGEAKAHNDPQIAQRYPWLHAQFDLESAACLNLNDEAARNLSLEALSIAQLHGFPSLELRATAFLAELYQYMGDNSSAWKYSTEGLTRFWQGGYPPMRGYSLYVGADLESEGSELWHLDTQILKEAEKYVADDPDFAIRAMEKYRLANAFAMAGDFNNANEELQGARALFSHSPDGVRKTNLEMEAQIFLARLDLLRLHPMMSIERLEPLRKKICDIPDEDLHFEYFTDLGLAYFAVGKPAEAQRTLDEALELEEQSLQRNDNERERLIWSRKADRVYRTKVQLDAAISPRNAFAQWESFKGASVRHTSSTLLNPDPTATNPDDARRLSVPLSPNTILISYAVLPKGPLVWIYDGHTVRQINLSISAAEIDVLSRRFAEDCARPESPLTTVLSESRLLYQELIAPLEPFLSSYKHLVIEPDAALWLIPFAALKDQSAVFLGDRFNISFSPGIEFLAASAPWAGVSAASFILVAGDPEMSNEKPLDDALEEAKGIARQFRYNQLLLEREASAKRISESLRNAEVFHFSGHATASPDGVALLLGDSTVLDVTRVRAKDFSHLRLAVLSACNSANGAADVFDDRDSLARLLVGAGVVDVVASRWMVDSHATSKLMREFYAQLLSGKDVSSALAEASRQLRANREFVHPFYWAGFSAFVKS